MHISAGDTAWMLTSSALVFLMSPGLAFFYAGLVRRKNVLNTLMLTCSAISIGALIWMMFGYSLAFSPGNPLLGGISAFFFSGVGQEPNSYAPTIPALVFASYQGMFASITPAIISGAIVERIKFSAFLVFLALWSLVVYVPVAHWVWGEGGWMRTLGALDFAGGTVVHITAGIAAVICAWLLGARHDHQESPLIPHNVPFVLLGAGLLWFGWFGFNAGSALAANGTAALALVNTNTAAAGAMITWLILESTLKGKPTAVGAATGAVVGLVGITPAAGFVYPWAALIIGIVTAIAGFAVIQQRAKTNLDDTLDVFACHGVGGITGALLTGVFATKAVNSAGADGLLYGNPKLLAIQALAVVATVAYTAVASGLLIQLVKLFMPIRAGLTEELEGLDRHTHGEDAYHEGIAITTLGGTEREALASTH
ncbi:MAG: ammonium transporter [Leptolyngbya sp.]|nr:ammonium transporter [Candidatus Melainabacteria bacterium]